MNENINLIEILKDAPKGTKLWSPICGECELVGIDGEIFHPIICRTKSDGGDIGCEAFTADGKFYCNYKNGECVLFPSKENRDWSTFKVPQKHKHFEPFQKVLTVYRELGGDDIWIIDLYSHYKNGFHYTMSADRLDDDRIIPYKGNEDKVGKLV